MEEGKESMVPNLMTVHLMENIKRVGNVIDAI
jgi:hypothetical protein